jgi:hypothetical protein
VLEVNDMCSGMNKIGAQRSGDVLKKVVAKVCDLEVWVQGCDMCSKSVICEQGCDMCSKSVICEQGLVIGARSQ